MRTKRIYTLIMLFFLLKVQSKIQQQKIVLHAHDFEMFVQELFSMLFLLPESRNVFESLLAI